MTWIDLLRQLGILIGDPVDVTTLLLVRILKLDKFCQTLLILVTENIIQI